MSANRKTANAFVQALDNKDIAQLSSLTSDDFKYYNHPRPPVDGVDKAGFLSFISSLSFIERWDFNYKEPISFIENEKERQLVLHMSATTRTSWGKTYDPEFVWFLHFNEEGKIDWLKEMFDTLYVQTILADSKAYSESA